MVAEPQSRPNGAMTATSSTYNELRSIVSKPGSFDGDLKKWSVWRFQLENFMAIVDCEYQAEMDTARRLTTPVGPPATPEVAKISTLLYNMLSGILSGRPFVTLRGVAGHSGYEAWRQICAHCEPPSANRHLALLPSITQGAQFADTTQDFVVNVQKWEIEIVAYETASSEALQDSVKRAILLKHLPAEFRSNILYNIDRYDKYETLRSAIFVISDSARVWTAAGEGAFTSTSGDVDMGGVSGIDKGGKGGKGGKGKGKGKDKNGKGKDKNGKGKDKNGKGKDKRGKSPGGAGQGKGGKTSGSWRDAGCFICGKQSHMAKDCHQRNLATIDQETADKDKQVSYAGTLTNEDDWLIGSISDKIY